MPKLHGCYLRTIRNCIVKIEDSEFFYKLKGGLFTSISMRAIIESSKLKRNCVLTYNQHFVFFSLSEYRALRFE